MEKEHYRNSINKGAEGTEYTTQRNGVRFKMAVLGDRIDTMGKKG